MDVIHVGPHASDDQLELYSLDRLSDTDLIQVEEHLMVCSGCRDRLEDASAFALAMRKVLKEHPVAFEKPDEENWFSRLLSGWKTPSLAFAGAMAAVVLSVGLYTYTQGHSGAGMTTAPVAYLQLTAMRGELPSVHGAKAVQLRFSEAVESGGPYKVSLVADDGSAVWNGVTQGPNVRLDRSLPKGTYFARLFGPSGQLLHEYGFRVTE